MERSGYVNGQLRYPVSVVDHNKTLIDPQLEEIQEVIPEDASPDNLLATDESVATSSATFRGTSDPGLTEEQFLAWADSLTKDKNDTCYWQTTDGSKAIFKRYKYNGTQWLFEYNVADPSSIPTALADLTDDATHRLVTDTEKSTWTGKQDPATTLAGYGITDTYTKAEADAKFVASTSFRNIVSLTQAQYDQITPDAETLYYIIES